MIRRYLSYIDFLAFVPLAVFMEVVEFHSAKFPDRWVHAYYYTFGPAVFFSAVGFLIFPQSAKLWLGTNVWFTLLGGLVLLGAWDPLEVLGMTFQESGGFVTTACIGFASCLIAPGSFVGAPPGAVKGRMLSWLLTAIAMATAWISFSNQGDRALSIGVPVSVFLVSDFVFRRVLVRRAHR